MTISSWAQVCFCLHVSPAHAQLLSVCASCCAMHPLALGWSPACREPLGSSSTGSSPRPELGLRGYPSCAVLGPPAQELSTMAGQ